MRCICVRTTCYVQVATIGNREVVVLVRIMSLQGLRGCMTDKRDESVRRAGRSTPECLLSTSTAKGDITVGEKGKHAVWR